MMKAAVLSRRGRDGLALCDVPMPVRKAGEVLVRVRAAALNRVDLYMRDVGIGITHSLPMIVGTEGAGEVAAADPGSRFKPGAKIIINTGVLCLKCRYCLAGDHPLCESVRIAGEHINGTFAEYVSLPEQCIFELPDSVDMAEAGVLRSAHLTAWRMLFGKETLRPGETVLVVGIGGGVAVACLQLALVAGAQVIVTSSSDAKLKRAAALGALAGVNYKTEQVAKRVLELTGGQGVDMVIDSSGAASWGDSLRSLRRGGRLVTCGATTGSNPGADLQRMFIRQLTVYGSTGGNLAEYHAMLKLFVSGGFHPVIDKTYPFSELLAAYDFLEHGEQFGKIAVSID